MDSYTSSSTKPLYRATQIIWYLVGLLQALLFFRFVLKLLEANPEAGFTSFIYGVTNVFTAPFLTVFGITKVSGTGSIFEWTTLLAMLVYWLIALAIVKLFLMGRSVSTPEAARKMDDQEKS